MFGPGDEEKAAEFCSGTIDTGLKSDELRKDPPPPQIANTAI